MKPDQGNDSLNQVSHYFKPYEVVKDGCFSSFDQTETCFSNALVYAQNLHYFQKACQNVNVSAIICSADLIETTAGQLPDKAIVLSDNPRKSFFRLYKQLAKSCLRFPFAYGTGSGCQIHPSAVVSEKTHIGNRVNIDANAVIQDNVIIQDDVYIGPNVVLGAEGLITIREEDGSLFTVPHAGGVEIGKGSQILAGAVIAKSLFTEPTTVGQHCQVGIMTNIGHGAVLGDESIVSGNSVIAGRAKLANKVWVGTSSSIAQGLLIGESAQIKMGSVVVSNVKAGQVVSGNFAINHRITMERYLTSR